MLIFGNSGVAAMIRGSIEVARRTNVAGWIYAEAGTVRDRLILAFSGDRCVGAGKVDRFRKDLLEAKLGDGYCGFDFPIKLNEDESLGSVYVKLQNSDAALIQKHTQLIGPDDHAAAAGGTDLGAISPARVSWMQDRGWLDQHEYDFLKAVQTIGAYERGLRPVRRGEAEAPAPAKPESVVQDLLGLFAMGDVEISRTKIASISDLAAETSPMRTRGLSVMALWSSERCRLALDERSHTRPVNGHGTVTAAPSPGAIEYGFGPDRMLFVHRQASFAPHGMAPADGITVFTAVTRTATLANTGVRKNKAA
jgi:hypothetical protein